MKSKKGPEAKVKQKVTQSLLQKGYKLETIQLVMNEIDFWKLPIVIEDGEDFQDRRIYSYAY